MSHSYAAVVHAFLREHNLEAAKAVLYSNISAPVSYEKSWQALTAALFNSSDEYLNGRALALMQLVGFLNYCDSFAHERSQSLRFLFLRREPTAACNLINACTKR